NLAHAVFLVDLMLLIPGCHSLDNLLWANFTNIINQRNNGTNKKPAYNCSQLHTLCLTEIFNLHQDVWEIQIFSLIEHCVRATVCHVSSQNEAWEAESLVQAIELVASPQSKGKMNTRGGGIAKLIHA